MDGLSFEYGKARGFYNMAGKCVDQITIILDIYFFYIGRTFNTIVDEIKHGNNDTIKWTKDQKTGISPLPR